MTDSGKLFEGDDPIGIARRWLEEAALSEPSYPEAVALSTVDESGMPNTRIVLLKAIEDDGFVFFTNYSSDKGREIAASGKASINCYWKSLGRQIRVRGTIEKVSDAASDAYYVSRPLGSRIGAWASQQSMPLESRQALLNAVKNAEDEYGEDPPRPPHWGGYKIVPRDIEFWADGEFRLHDRFRWSRDENADSWSNQRLFP